MSRRLHNRKAVEDNEAGMFSLVYNIEGKMSAAQLSSGLGRGIYTSYSLIIHNIINQITPSIHVLRALTVIHPAAVFMGCLADVLWCVIHNGVGCPIGNI